MNRNVLAAAILLTAIPVTVLADVAVSASAAPTHAPAHAAHARVLTPDSYAGSSYFA